MKGIAMMKYFKPSGIILMAVFLSVFFSNVLYGQMYIQGSLQYSFYDYHDPLELVDVNPDFTVGLGIMIFANKESKFEIASELNTFHRNFSQVYDEAEFKYIFRGFEFRLLTNYSISTKLYLESGFMAATYAPQLRMNGEVVVLGEGFSEVDYGAFVGCHYFLNESLILGTRFDFWFNTMLEYDSIGDYGELKSGIKDIRANTAEIFIRFQFLNQWK